MLNYNNFLKHTFEKFPFWEEPLTKNPFSPFLFSNSETYLKQEDFDSILRFIQLTYHLRNKIEFVQSILGKPALTNQKSVLMSFDFHMTENGPKLIEINTNASHFLTSFIYSDYAAQALNRPFTFANCLEQLITSFSTEFEFFNQARNSQVKDTADLTPKLRRIAIVDEDPLHQRAYTEFLMYQKLFLKNGIEADICDISDVSYNSAENSLLNKKNEPIDLVYNRFTDFYLEREASKQLKLAHQNLAACFSPNPEEYQLLSDKNRLTTLSSLDFLNTYLSQEESLSIKKSLLEIFEVHTVPKEALWQNRKKYFFKPTTSHGAKGVYEGSKITHTVFDKIYSEKSYLAQEMAPPSRTRVTVDGKPQDAKIDFRFFVYNGVVQHMIGRSYIGQTTNFKTLGCGFTPVFIK